MIRAALVLPLVLGAGFLALSIGPGAAAAEGATPSLLHSREFPSNDLSALPQWTRVLRRMPAERAQIARCDADIAACSSTREIAWRAKVQQLRSAYPMDQIREVNTYANQWPRHSDEDIYGVEDYWAAPLEFLKHGGDSEDFAIFKFFMLRELGFDNDHLRIVIARDTLRNRPAALLAVYLDGHVYLLDDLSDAVREQADAGYDVPYYSVNETTRWAHVEDTGSARATKAN